MDLERLERLAGGLAVLFYGLLLLAFVTAIMGSGAGGLLLLVLGAAAHVGRVGLEEMAAKRREAGGATATSADDSERATGLRLKWLPREIRFGASRPTNGRGEAAGRVAAGAGQAAGAALGHAGELLGIGTASVRTSFAALMAEVREQPALRRGDGGMGIEGEALDYDFEDFDDAPPPRFEVGADEDFGFDEEIAGRVFDGGRRSGGDPDSIDVPDFFRGTAEPAEPDVPAETAEPAASGEAAVPLELAPSSQSTRSPRPGRAKRAGADAPTAQERYEARRLARGERGEDEPIVTAVEEAETQAPQRVSRRKPGGRPDPLQTRRPTRAR